MYGLVKSFSRKSISIRIKIRKIFCLITKKLRTPFTLQGDNYLGGYYFIGKRVFISSDKWDKMMLYVPLRNKVREKGAFRWRIVLL